MPDLVKRIIFLDMKRTSLLITILILIFFNSCTIEQDIELNKDDIKERVKYIASQEEINISSNGLNALVEVSKGDCRRAINYLQSCGTISKQIDQDIVFRVAGEVPPEKIREILKTALEGQLQFSLKLLNDITREYGLSGINIIKNIHREIYGLNISEDLKIEISKLLAEFEYRLSQGGTEEIQLHALLANIVMLNQSE